MLERNIPSSSPSTLETIKATPEVAVPLAAPQEEMRAWQPLAEVPEMH